LSALSTTFVYIVTSILSDVDATFMMTWSGVALAVSSREYCVSAISV